MKNDINKIMFYFFQVARLFSRGITSYKSCILTNWRFSCNLSSWWCWYLSMVSKSSYNTLQSAGPSRDWPGPWARTEMGSRCRRLCKPLLYIPYFSSHSRPRDPFTTPTPSRRFGLLVFSASFQWKSLVGISFSYLYYDLGRF